MAYNLSTVRERVRNRLDDEDFEQEYLDRAINYAQWDITNNSNLRFLETTQPYTLNEGDHTLDLPSDFHAYKYLRLSAPVDFRMNLTDAYKDYDDFVNDYIDPTVFSESVPYHWSEFGSKIIFSAPADQTYTINLDYQRRAAELVNEDDVPDIPEEFAELLEIGAYMRIAKREDDYDVKSAEMADYSKLLLDLKSVYGRKKGPGGLRKMRVA